MRPPGRSSAAAARWPAAASGSNSRWPRAPCVGARRTCVPPRKYWPARTRIRGVAPRTNPPSLFSCALHLQPTVTGRQGRSCSNNRWAIPEYQSGPKNDIEARRGFALLGVDVQRVVQILQQASHGRRTHRMANGFQSIAQAAQAAAYPDLAGHWVTRRFGFDQLLQGGDDGQVFFFVRGRPPPGSRTRSTGRSTSEAANSWRPRRIVFSSTPVISNKIRSA